MSTFDKDKPAQSDQALSDVDAIRNNLIALRDIEGSASASPPSNPVSGMLWWATDTTTMYQRNQANTSWVFRWSEADPPAKSSDLTNHIALDITPSVEVHGIKQGSGNGFDADLLDGNEASAFLAVSHGTATSGIHGVGGSTVESASGAQAKVDAHDALLSAHSNKLVTNGDSHDHSGGDGAQIIETGIANSAIAQGKLKITTGSEVSTASSAEVNIVLPGGKFGFYPQIRMSNTGTSAWRARILKEDTYGGFTALATYIALAAGEGGGAMFAQQTYITASPPYKIGNVIWGHFMFLLRSISTGDIISAYESPEPPWAYNGKDYLPKDHKDRIQAVPHPFVDYWDKNPATDGLEIVLVDLRDYDTKKWKNDNWKIGKGLLEDLPGKVNPNKIIVPGSIGMPEIQGFTDKVKIRERI